MIRDPSDGSAREKPVAGIPTAGEDPSVLGSPPMVSGLPPEKAKEAERLKESREWLKQYFEPKA